MLHYLCLGETVRASGVAVLSYRISLPTWDEKERMSGFYRKIADKTEEFCKSKLIPLAEEDYSASDDPKKRFRYAPFFYSLTGKVSEEKEGLLSVLLEAKWGKRGEEPLLGQGFDAHTWEWEEESLLPPEQVTSRLLLPKLKRKELRRCRGLFFEREKVFFCFPKEVREVSSQGKTGGENEEKIIKNS